MSVNPDHIPGPKLERWKYTNLPRALKTMALEPARLGWSDNVKLMNPDAPGAMQYRDMMLWDLNTQDSRDIKFLNGSDEIPIDAQVGQYLSPRLIIHVRAGEDVTIIERQGGKGAYWKNGVTQITVDANARLRHYRFFDEADGGVSTQSVHVKIARDARYEGLSIIGGAGTVRNQFHAEIQGPNADCTVSGINLLSGAQHADTTITIEHQAPNCTSNQLFKNVVTDKARGVFQGKVHVHQIAQKTDGYQLSNTLLLSPLAEMDTKPELEIYADDVKCSHGATTGQLDDEPLFYMQSRGIPEPQARALLIESFALRGLEKVTDDGIVMEVGTQVAEWLKQHVK